MQQRKFNIGPFAIAAAAANILNGAVTSLAGPVGITLAQPYLLIRHMRVVNKSGAAVSCTLYKGATGGSTAGTEVAFAASSVPANGYLDWYGELRLDSADFLTGVAGTVSTLVLNIEGEVGFSG